MEVSRNQGIYSEAGILTLTPSPNDGVIGVPANGLIHRLQFINISIQRTKLVKESKTDLLCRVSISRSFC